MIRRIAALPYAFLVKYHLRIALVIAAFSVLTIVLVRVQLLATFHPDISGSERSSVMPIQYVIQGKELYKSPELPPFYIVQYTPLYFWTVGAAYKWAGFDKENVHKIFVASRVASLAYVLLACFVFFLTLTKILEEKITIALLASALFFGICSHWNIYFSRIDSLLLLGTSTVVYCMTLALRAPQKKRELWYLAIAVLVAIGMVLVKQSGIFLLSFLLFFLFTQRYFKLLGWFSVGGGAAGLLAYVGLGKEKLLNLYKNVIQGINNGINLDWFYHFTLKELLLPFAPFLVTAMIVSVFWLGKQPDRYRQFVALGVIWMFASALLTSTKLGAAVGYFIEFILLSVLATCLYFFGQEKRVVHSNISRIWLSFFSALVLFFFSLSIYKHYTSLPLGYYKALYLNEHGVASFVKKELREGEYIYMQDGSDYQGYFMAHFLLDKTLAPMNDLVYLAQERNSLNFDAFHGLIESGRLRYMIVPGQDIKGAIMGYEGAEEKFHFLQNINGYDIYEHELAGSSTVLQSVETLID